MSAPRSITETIKIRVEISTPDGSTSKDFQISGELYDAIIGPDQLLAEIAQVRKELREYISDIYQP